jgi:hypothetical protein
MIAPKTCTSLCGKQFFQVANGIVFTETEGRQSMEYPQSKSTYLHLTRTFFPKRSLQITSIITSSLFLMRSAKRMPSWWMWMYWSSTSTVVSFTVEFSLRTVFTGAQSFITGAHSVVECWHRKFCPQRMKQSASLPALGSYSHGSSGPSSSQGSSVDSNAKVIGVAASASEFFVAIEDNSKILQLAHAKANLNGKSRVKKINIPGTVSGHNLQTNATFSSKAKKMNKVTLKKNRELAWVTFSAAL